MSDGYMVCVTVAPAFENILVDWLLNDTPRRGFTCIPVFGHGVATHSMSTMDEIVGRVKHVQFEVLCENRAHASDLIERLVTAFPNIELRYWIYPVLEQGKYGPSK